MERFGEQYGPAFRDFVLTEVDDKVTGLGLRLDQLTRTAELFKVPDEQTMKDLLQRIDGIEGFMRSVNQSVIEKTKFNTRAMAELEGRQLVKEQELEHTRLEIDSFRGEGKALAAGVGSVVVILAQLLGLGVPPEDVLAVAQGRSESPQPQSPRGRPTSPSRGGAGAGGGSPRGFGGGLAQETAAAGVPMHRHQEEQPLVRLESLSRWLSTRWQDLTQDRAFVPLTDRIEAMQKELQAVNRELDETKFGLQEYSRGAQTLKGRFLFS